MSRRLSYLAAAFLLLSCLAGCSGRGRVIPRDKLVKIYYDIIVLDQWVREHPASQPVVDTTLFFEPIFERYGYTFEDYDNTVHYYVDKPDKFAKVFDAVELRLRARQKHFEELAKKYEEIEDANRHFENYKPRNYGLDGILFADSLLRQIREFPSFSLMLPDSAVVDSLAVRDSLAAGDSIASSVQIRGSERKLSRASGKAVKKIEPEL